MPELRFGYIPRFCWWYELLAMLGGHVFGCRCVRLHELRLGSVPDSFIGDVMHVVRCRVLLDGDRAVLFVNVLELRGGDSVGCRCHLLQLMCRGPVPKLRGCERMRELHSGYVLSSGVICVRAV